MIIPKKIHFLFRTKNVVFRVQHSIFFSHLLSLTPPKHTRSVRIRAQFGQFFGANIVIISPHKKKSEYFLKKITFSFDRFFCPTATSKQDSTFSAIWTVTFLRNYDEKTDFFALNIINICKLYTDSTTECKNIKKTVQKDKRKKRCKYVSVSSRHMPIYLIYKKRSTKANPFAPLSNS